MQKVLIVSPHPDDAELAMGGTIAKMVEAGFDVKIVDLTDGEPTPFGTRQNRLREASTAAEILGVSRINLDMPNRKLQANLENRRTLAQIFREHKPDMMFGPVLPDLHPDHNEAVRLIEYSRFDAKLCKTDMSYDAHWVPKYYQYFSPHRNVITGFSFVVDISKQWQAKVKSILAYQSQLKHLSASNNNVPLIRKIWIVNSYFGIAGGTAFAEPFFSADMVCFKNVCDLF